MLRLLHSSACYIYLLALPLSVRRTLSGAYKSYAEVLASFNRGDLHRMSTGYGVWITRAVIVHGCSFAMLDLVKQRLILAGCV